MSDLVAVECVICGTAFEAEKYGSGRCVCGQEYRYVEDHAIVLTPYQRAALQNLAPPPKEPST